jgi:hypothetical protein
MTSLAFMGVVVKRTSACIALAIFLFCTPAHAEYKFADSWTWKDTAYQATFLTLLGVDYGQTRTMAKNNWILDGRLHYESCPVLPRHPSTSEVDLYFGLSALAHTIIALALPPEAKIFDFKINPRRIWQSVWIATEAGYVGYNYSVGVRIEF